MDASGESDGREKERGMYKVFKREHVLQRILDVFRMIQVDFIRRSLHCQASFGTTSVWPTHICPGELEMQIHSKSNSATILKVSEPWEATVLLSVLGDLGACNISTSAKIMKHPPWRSGSFHLRIRNGYYVSAQTFRSRNQLYFVAGYQDRWSEFDWIPFDSRWSRSIKAADPNPYRSFDIRKSNYEGGN